MVEFKDYSWFACGASENPECDYYAKEPDSVVCVWLMLTHKLECANAEAREEAQVQRVLEDI